MLVEPWHIFLFGGLRARCGERTVERFRTQKTGALLAYLALNPQRQYGREELAELLWSESDPEASRTNLRVAVASLRRQLEPPGVPQGTVLVSTHSHLCLRPEAVITDSHEFETFLGKAGRAPDPAERRNLLVNATALYQGRLLPHLYDDWVLQEQARFSQAYGAALEQLLSLYEERGDLKNAIDCAGRLVQHDSLREESHADLIRLYSLSGQNTSAQQQYRRLEEILRTELNAVPSPAVRALIAASPSDSRERQKRGERVQNAALPSLPAQEPTPARGREQKRSSASLPLFLTRFFGREEELRVLEANLLAPGTRLVTLTGTGGTGKTRLVVETVHRLQASFESVAFVPLAEVTETRAIFPAIAEALALPRNPLVEPLEQIIEHLYARACLLVLDNFEQLVVPGTSVLTTLLGQIPGLTLLVTSRQACGLDGERRLPVPPLPIPADAAEGREPKEAGNGANPDPVTLLNFPAVQLFVDRVQAIRPDFTLTSRNAAAVATLCARLDGLPLAIELAAAWSGALTPAQMVDRLTGRFDLLVSRRNDLSPRHRTLWNAIAWSYDLLSADLQAFFIGLSVFRGGWTLEAAEAICGRREESAGEERSEGDECGGAASPMEMLIQLCERSLILSEETAGGEQRRFRMLEPLREFAEAQRTATRRLEQERRHIDYFLKQAETAQDQRETALQGAWLIVLDQEQDNVRAAITRSLALAAGTEAEEGVAVAMRLCADMNWYWTARGLHLEAEPYIAQALTTPLCQAPTLSRAHALYLRGCIAQSQGEYVEAKARYEEALPLYRQYEELACCLRVLKNQSYLAWVCGDYQQARDCVAMLLEMNKTVGSRAMEANAATMLGLTCWRQGEIAQAEAYFRASLHIWKELQSGSAIAVALNNLANLMKTRGMYVEAVDFYTQALELNRASGTRAMMAMILNNLASIHKMMGDYAQAMPLYEESLALYEALHDKQGCSMVLNNLGLAQDELGDYEAACTLHRRTLALREQLGERKGVADSWFNLGIALFSLGQHAQGQKLLEDAFLRYEEIGDREGMSGILAVQGQQALSLHDVSAARRCIAEAWEIVCAIGYRLRTHELIAICAHIAVASGQQVAAARLFGAAAQSRRELPTSLTPESQEEETEILARLSLDLGEAACSRYIAEGALWTEARAIEAARALVRDDLETVQLRLA